MDVRIVTFPVTRVAAVAHHGPPGLEHDTVRRLIAWKLEHRLLDPAKHRHYGVHYTDPDRTPPADHRADFCLSFEGDVAPNPHGVVAKTIPGGRCATARHLGSRAYIAAAVSLCEQWLPASGESLGLFPIFFHYVNVGPGVREENMVTDVYLPLR